MEKNGLKNGPKTIHPCVCKGLASEYEVKFTGTYRACMNYISWAKNTSQKY